MEGTPKGVVMDAHAPRDAAAADEPDDLRRRACWRLGGRMMEADQREERGKQVRWAHG
jgi:hypothetical protein